MFESLEPAVGFAWTMRACALVIFVLAVIANITISSRVAPVKRHFHVKEYILPFRSNTYRLLCLSTLMYFGLFLPLTYIILQAKQEGMSEYLAGKLVVIINAASRKYHI